MNVFKRCSNCKGPIGLGGRYFVCNVSTCNRPRTGLFFCSVDCWDAHLPIAKHRDAWAEERVAPAEPQSEVGDAEGRQPRRIDMRRPGSGQRPPPEVLVVTSKVKAYIKARNDMNCSTGAMEPLSEHVRRICEIAMDNARQEGRRTVLDRDVPRVGQLETKALN